MTTDLRLNQPRYASLPNIMKAKKKPLEEKTPADYGVDTSPRIKVLKTSEPPRRQAGVKVKSVGELVRKLKDEAGVIGVTPWTPPAAAGRSRRRRSDPLGRRDDSVAVLVQAAPAPGEGDPRRLHGPGPGSASVASVHRVAAIPQAPGEFLLRGDGFVARGHRVEVPVQPWAKVLAVLPNVPRGPVALLVLTKAILRRHHALADVEGGIPRVAAGTDRVVQLDHVHVVAAPVCSWPGCA